MNRDVIGQELRRLGIPGDAICFRWLGSDGPGVVIGGTGFAALLPIDDGSDLRFAEWVRGQVKDYYAIHSD
jgi:hypothetical protein